jgi:CubicO group peptidase (beta-lactamase class C family)
VSRRWERLQARAAAVCGLLLVTSCARSTADVAVPIVAPRATVERPALTPTSEQPAVPIEPSVAEPGTDLPSVIVPESTTTPPSVDAPPATASPSTAAPTELPTSPPLAPPSQIIDPGVTLPPPVNAPRTPVNPWFGAANVAFDRLAAGNTGASMTIVSGGAIVYGRAAGRTIDGDDATSDTPMVVASVSKLVVAVAIARLQSFGVVDVAGPMPWADLGLAPNIGWNDVTVRELLDHRGGLAKARTSWFTGEGTCRDYIPSLLVAPPNGDRGRWVYSNGNYCLLGLLVEQRMGVPLDQALQQLVFDPIEANGVHATYGGLQGDDLQYEPGVDRLSRLGGAGTLIVSTDDLARLLGRLTANDLEVLKPPGVFTDQYGFGHTGSVDFAKSCVWLFDAGTTVVSATVAGESVGSGGDVCDIVVPAVATDLGIGQGPPDRTP